MRDDFDIPSGIIVLITIIVVFAVLCGAIYQTIQEEKQFEEKIQMATIQIDNEYKTFVVDHYTNYDNCVIIYDRNGNKYQTTQYTLWWEDAK